MSDKAAGLPGSPSMIMSNYYVTHFSFDDPHGALNGTQNAMNLEIDSRAIDGEHDGSSRLYSMEMAIYVNEAFERPTSESLCCLKLVGEFVAVACGGLTADEARAYLNSKGAEELYSMAKSVLVMLTATCPSGTVMLPSISL